MGMWVVPLISHMTQYNDHSAIHPSYGLTVAVTVILCMQCAVDCLLFCSREKPWKHISDTSGGIVESLKVWEVFDKERRGSNSHSHGGFKRRGGMSREEMSVQARRAYRRREEELAARVLERGERRSQVRSWWDDGFDGAGRPCSIVIEEWDPLDIFPTRPSERGNLPDATTLDAAPDAVDEDDTEAIEKAHDAKDMNEPDDKCDI